MPEFTATITLDTVDVLTEDVLFDVAAIGGAATGDPGTRRITTTLTVEADGHLEAIGNASEAIAAVVAGTVVSCTVMNTEEHDRQTDARAFPELVGIAETAERLGVTRQRASQLQAHRDFPEPVQVLRSGPVWRLDDLTRFVDGWDRRGGRPKAST